MSFFESTSLIPPLRFSEGKLEVDVENYLLGARILKKKHLKFIEIINKALSTYQYAEKED